MEKTAEKNSSNLDIMWIKNNGLSVVAIVMLAVYYVQQFMTHYNYKVGGCYLAVLLVLSYFVVKKDCFHKTIDIFIKAYLIGEILEAFVLNGDSTKWITARFQMAYIENVDTVTKLFDVKYTYVYIICIVLLSVVLFAGSQLDYDFKTLLICLGIYSGAGVLLQFFFMHFGKFEKLAGISFLILAIYAFVNARYHKKINMLFLLKALVTVILCCLTEILYLSGNHILYQAISNMYDLKWFYYRIR